jgi:hypothetical protein
MLANKLKGAGGASPITFEFVDWAQSGRDQTYISVPAAAQAGDFAVILASSLGNYIRTSISGWNTDATETTSSIRSATHSKILDGTESSVLALNGYTHSNAVIIVFRPSSEVTNIYRSTTTWTNDASNPPAISAVVDGNPEPHILVGTSFCWLSNTPNLSGTYWTDTLLFDPGLARFDLGYELQNDYAEDRTVDSNNYSNTYNQNYAGMYSFD